jgi:hypothetical protein
MSSRGRLSVVATAFALYLPLAPLAAQKAPNFSGTWVLALDKSDFGGMQGGARTDVIDHQEPKLVIKRSISGGPQGDVQATLTYAIDGKPYKNTLAGNEITSTLKWDGPVLVMESTVSTAQGEAAVNDRFALSEDGKTLTVTRAIAMGGQTLSQRLVFSKE